MNETNTNYNIVGVENFQPVQENFQHLQHCNNYFIMGRKFSAPTIVVTTMKCFNNDATNKIYN